MSLPNLLTFFRMFLAPTLIVAFYLPGRFSHILATIIFIAAALTDFMDGYLARSLRRETKFGAFLDPVADKLVVSVALILIVAEIGTFYIAIPAAVIVCREITISALREWMSEVGKSANVTVNYIGKIKTALQMIAVAVLLYYCPKCQDSYWYFIIGLVLLYSAASMTIWSMYLYLKMAWHDLTKS